MRTLNSLQWTFKAKLLAYVLFCCCSLLGSSYSTRMNSALFHIKHLSIFYTRLICQSGRRGAGTPVIGREAGYTLDRSPVHHRATQRQTRQTTTDTFTITRAILESPINLTCMFLDGGRKPEYPERTHTYKGRTCKLHTEKPRLEIEPGTLLLWGDGANHHTTVQPPY